jgi:hypothetical protein
MIEEILDDKFKAILSELEKMTELVKQPSQKTRQIGEHLLSRWWIAVKSISFCLVAHSLFQEMVQRANPDFPVPVHNLLKYHIKRLAEIYRQL